MADIAAVTSIEITARDLTRGAISSIKGGLTELGNAAGSLRGVLGALGVSLSAAAFTVAIKNAIDYADQLNDLAKKTGIAVETLGGLGYVAEQTGTSLEAIAKGTSKLATLMAEAAGGSAKAASVFDAMGVSVKNIDGSLKSMDETLLDVADRFASYEDGAAKAALANQVFGEKLGAQLIPFLDEGGEKIRELVAEYQRYGGVTTETAARADQFNDTLSKISLMSSALMRELASALLPTLQAIANVFVNAKEQAAGFKGVTEGVIVVVKGLSVAAIATAEVFSALGKSIGTVLGAIMSYLRGDSLSSVWEGMKQGFGEVGASISSAMKNVETVVNASTASVSAGIQTNLGEKARAPVMALGAAAKKTADDFKELYEQAQSNIQGMQDYWAELERVEEAERAVAEAIADANTAMAVHVDAQLEAVRTYEAETAAIGMTRQALADMAIARQAELRDIRLMAGWGQEAIDIYERWAAAIRNREVVMAQQEQTQEMARLWQSVDRAAEDAFTNILQGGKNAFDRLKDALQNGLMALLYQLTVRPFIVNIAAAISGDPALAGALGGLGGGGMGGGGGNLLSLLSGAGSLFGGGGTLFGSSLAGGGIFSSGLGATFATSALGEGLGLSVALGAGEGMALTALGSMLGTAIPVIGAVLAIAALAGAFDKDPSEVRGRFGVRPGTSGFEDNAFTKSPVGNLGFLDEGTQYFSGEAAQVFNTLVGDTLAAFASRMDTKQIESLSGKLQGLDFGSFEGEYTTQEFIEKYGGEILQKVISTAFGELDPALQAVFDAFKGTADEAAEFANVLLTVHDLTENIPTDLRETLIAALDGTAEMSEQVIAFAGAYVTLQEVMNRDPLEDALNAIAAASDSAYGALMKQADAFEELIDAYDGSAAASEEIAQATVDYYNALVNVIAGIRQLRTSIGEMFDKTIEDMMLETMSDADKGTYYANQIDLLSSQLSTATDPAEIERITSQINEYMRAAFGLLTPEEQVQMLDQYASFAREIAALADERLLAAEEAAQARADALFAQLRSVLEGAANDMKVAGADMKQGGADTKSAANTLLAAVRTPITVVVETDDVVDR